MYRRIASLLLIPALLFSVGAGAAPRDNAANEKIKEAIDVHYLATEFDKAEGLLKAVLDACEDRCSPEVKGRSWMFIGIVRGAGKQDLGGAQDAFQQALALDPKVKLEDSLATPEVQAAFAAAAAALGVAAPAAGPSTAPSGEVPGSMECTPTVREVESQRTIPVACKTDEPAVKVALRYMVFGGEQWQQVELKKKGEYWQGEIPCADTGVTGKLKFYVQAKDQEGEELDSMGSKKQPVEINLVRVTEEDPPAYPGQGAPEKCMEASACPEDMIGTPACPGTGGSKRGNKGWGAPCDTSQECESGLLCMQGDSGRTCETAPSCESTADCPDGSACVGGTCDVSDDGGSGPAGPFKKNWLGLHFGVDLAFLSGTNVCVDGSGFSCFYGNDVPYTGTPDPDNAGSLNGGAAIGTMRILASYERILVSTLGAEARVGFAFNGGPKPQNGNSFLPIHIEVRGKYWFGSNVLSNKGIRPYVFLGGGMAQVDAKLTVRMRDITAAPVEQDLFAYKKLGQGFVAGGGGLMYGIAPNHGPIFNLSAMFMLGASGLVLEPSLGYEFGL